MTSAALWEIHYSPDTTEIGKKSGTWCLHYKCKEAEIAYETARELLDNKTLKNIGYVAYTKYYDKYCKDNDISVILFECGPPDNQFMVEQCAKNIIKAMNYERRFGVLPYIFYSSREQLHCSIPTHFYRYRLESCGTKPDSNQELQFFKYKFVLPIIDSKSDTDSKEKDCWCSEEHANARLQKNFCFTQKAKQYDYRFKLEDMSVLNLKEFDLNPNWVPSWKFNNENRVCNNRYDRNNFETQGLKYGDGTQPIPAYSI